MFPKKKSYHRFHGSNTIKPILIESVSIRSIILSLHVCSFIYTVGTPLTRRSFLPQFTVVNTLQRLGGFDYKYTKNIQFLLICIKTPQMPNLLSILSDIYGLTNIIILKKATPNS